MLTFALDTSTASPSLALVRDERPVAERWLRAEPGAGRRVLEAGHDLMASAGVEVGELDEIVAGVGPGGFTGLRIGLATALGLGQALGVPVVGASSLEALALDMTAGLRPGVLLAPVLDARRRELFAAVHRWEGGDALTQVIAPRAVAPDELRELLVALGEEVRVGGEGIAAAGGALDAPNVQVAAPADHHPRATALVRRVRAGGGLPARPVYARLPDAEVNRLRALRAGAGT